MRKPTLIALALLGAVQLASAADPLNPEDFKVEVTAGSWITDTSGNVQSSGTVVDFRSDLNFQQQTPTFFGTLAFKPGKRHRIVMEGGPFSFSGRGAIHRTIVFQGQTFQVNEDLSSQAQLTHVYGGYQYDFLSGPKGHLGVNVGGLYLDGNATVSSVGLNTTASRGQNLGLPVAGLEGRVFPIAGHKWLDIDAGIRGMDFGSYGHFIEGSVNGGVWIGTIGLRAGYRELETQLQQTGSNAGGILVHMKGPIFSATWRW